VEARIRDSLSGEGATEVRVHLSILMNHLQTGGCENAFVQKGEAGGGGGGKVFKQRLSSCERAVNKGGQLQSIHACVIQVPRLNEEEVLNLFFVLLLRTKSVCKPVLSEHARTPHVYHMPGVHHQAAAAALCPVKVLPLLAHPRSVLPHMPGNPPPLSPHFR